MDIAAAKRAMERLKEFARLRATTQVEAALAQTDADAALEALEEARERRDEWRARAFRVLPSDTDEDDIGELWSEFAVEAQGKLRAVDEWYAELGSWGHIMLPRLDRTLHGSKEGE